MNATRPRRQRERALALLYGVACHGSFVAAVTALGIGLATGMQRGAGPLRGNAALLADGLLLLQFPLLHSLLLTVRGRTWLARLAPRDLGRTLAPTTFALVAALQLVATFVLWSPSGTVLWQPRGTALVLHSIAFAGAWAFLGKALCDAGLGLQTGWIGWTAAWHDARPRYPDLPERGAFALCRQPIYLGFALLLWTAPTWTPDRLAIALAWSTYCAVGPLHKERRFLALHGERFRAYRQRVPYLFPWSS